MDSSPKHVLFKISVEKRERRRPSELDLLTDAINVAVRVKVDERDKLTSDIQKGKVKLTTSVQKKLDEWLEDHFNLLDLGFRLINLKSANSRS